MTHYNPGPAWGPPAPPQRGMVDRPAFWIVIAVTALLAGSCGAAMGGSDDSRSDLAATSARPTATVTATVTASPPSNGKPQPNVTVTKKVEVTVTKTVTKQAAAPADDDSSGSESVYYRNCDAARAAGAAPVHRGDPGYGSHLDRDGDGTACE